MSIEKSKVRATLVYEDVAARYLEMQKQEEKANEKKLRFAFENNRDIYLYTAEGKRLWTEKGEGWHWRSSVAADEYAYCSLDRPEANCHWQYWGYKEKDMGTVLLS